MSLTPIIASLMIDLNYHHVGMNTNALLREEMVKMWIILQLAESVSSVAIHTLRPEISSFDNTVSSPPALFL